MKQYPGIICLLILICNGHVLLSQTKEAGPVIEEYGKVWKIAEPDYKTKTDKEFKAVFDVMSSPESHEQVNPWIETAARYLNMHAQAGVPVENIKAVLIVHNKASKDLMNDTLYRDKYGFSNPNRELIEALMNAGVEVLFCGQSSYSREIPKEKVIPGVQIALSAMTALIQLQDEGYRLIKF